MCLPHRNLLHCHSQGVHHVDGMQKDEVEGLGRRRHQAIPPAIEDPPPGLLHASTHAFPESHGDREGVHVLQEVQHVALGIAAQGS